MWGTVIIGRRMLNRSLRRLRRKARHGRYGIDSHVVVDLLDLGDYRLERFRGDEAGLIFEGILRGCFS